MRPATALFLAVTLSAADFTPHDLTLLPDEPLAGDWFELEMDGADRRNANVRWVIKGGDSADLQVLQNDKQINSGKLKIDPYHLPCRMEIHWGPNDVVPTIVRVTDGKLLVLLGRDKSIYQCEPDINSRHPAIKGRILFKRR